MELTELLLAVQAYVNDEKSNIGNVPRSLLQTAITESKRRDVVAEEMYYHGVHYPKISCQALDTQRSEWKSVACDFMTKEKFVEARSRIEHA